MLKDLISAITDTKTIIGAAVSLAVAAFTAGAFVHDLTTRISVLEEATKKVQSDLSDLKRENSTRQNEIAGFKAELNKQFERLRSDEIKDYGNVRQNHASQNGAGYSADRDGEGHCAAGSVVVGIQPRQLSDYGINFQCAKLPELKLTQ